MFENILDNKFKLVVVLLLLFGVMTRVVFGISKIEYRHDEMASIVLATNHKGYDEALKSPIYNSWQKAKEWKKFTQINPFDFETVKHNASKLDIHPPLYYSLLNVAMVIGGVNIYSGIGLNILFFMVSFFFLYKVLQIIFYKSNYLIAINLAVYAVSLMDVASDCFVRQYTLLYALYLATVYFMLRYFKVKKNRYLLYYAIALCLGFLTQYLFYVYALIFSVVIFLYYVRQKEVIPIVKFALVTLLALGVNVLIFPEILDFMSIEKPEFYKYDRLTTLFNSLFLKDGLVGIGLILAIIHNFRVRAGNLFYLNMIFIITFITYIVLYLLAIIPPHSLGGRYFLVFRMFNIIVLTSYFSDFLMNKKRVICKYVGLFVLLSVFVIIPLKARHNHKKLDKKYLSHARFIDGFDNIIIDNDGIGNFFRMMSRIDGDKNVFLTDINNLEKSFDEVIKGRDNLLYISSDYLSDKTKLFAEINDKYDVEYKKFPYGDMFVFRGVKK